jgi:hypothetical protein
MNAQADNIYLKIMDVALSQIRNFCVDGAWQCARIESEHIHNLPSLIGEYNTLRHFYYLNNERERYLASISNLPDTEPGKIEITKLVKIYIPLWMALQEVFSDKRDKCNNQ